MNVCVSALDKCVWGAGRGKGRDADVCEMQRGPQLNGPPASLSLGGANMTEVSDGGFRRRHHRASHRDGSVLILNLL